LLYHPRRRGSLALDSAPLASNEFGEANKILDYESWRACQLLSKRIRERAESPKHQLACGCPIGLRRLFGLGHNRKLSTGRSVGYGLVGLISRLYRLGHLGALRSLSASWS